MNKIHLILLSLIITLSINLSATQMIHYNKKAVMIELHKGQERTLHFGDHVEVGITKGMQEKQLFRVQSAQGSLHILPFETFGKQRIQVRRLGDNQVLLFDLISTVSNETLEDIKVIMPYENKIAGKNEESISNGIMNTAVITPIDLTRYIAQRLYGPTRLFKERAGISPSRIGVKGLIKLFKGKNLLSTSSKVVLAYQGGGYFVSALYIKNISSTPVKLDYLDLNIPFTHATFQHHVLNAKGRSGDSTILYLVSETPMKETLYPWSYYADQRVSLEPVQQPIEDEEDE